MQGQLRIHVLDAGIKPELDILMIKVFLCCVLIESCMEHYSKEEKTALADLAQ